MSFGNMLANAAEAERNRMHQKGMSDKQLEMQKYGIDTTASTSKYNTDKIYDIINEMKKYYFDKDVTDIEGKENIMEMIMSNKDIENIMNTQKEDLRSYNTLSIGDWMKGKKKYATHRSGAPMYRENIGFDDWLMSQYYKFDQGGYMPNSLFRLATTGDTSKDLEETMYPTLQSPSASTFKGMSPNAINEMMIQLGYDKSQIKNKSYNELLDLIQKNPSSYKVGDK